MPLIWKHASLRDKRLVFKNLNEINYILIDNLNVPYNAKFFLLVLIMALIEGTTTYCLSFFANSFMYVSLIFLQRGQVH